MKFLANLPKAPIGRHTTAASVSRLRGPQTSIPASRLLPTDFKIFKDTTIPSQCSGCGQSSVNEPDTANAGKVIQQTRDRFVYKGLTLGSGSTQGFTTATAASGTPTAWCVYHFDSSSFGGTAGELQPRFC